MQTAQQLEEESKSAEKAIRDREMSS